MKVDMLVNQAHERVQKISRLTLSVPFPRRTRRPRSRTLAEFSIHKPYLPAMRIKPFPWIHVDTTCIIQLTVVLRTDQPANTTFPYSRISPKLLPLVINIHDVTNPHIFKQIALHIKAICMADQDVLSLPDVVDMSEHTQIDFQYTTSLNKGITIPCNDEGFPLTQLPTPFIQDFNKAMVNVHFTLTIKMHQLANPWRIISHPLWRHYKSLRRKPFRHQSATNWSPVLEQEQDQH